MQSQLQVPETIPDGYLGLSERAIGFLRKDLGKLREQTWLTHEQIQGALLQGAAFFNPEVESRFDTSYSNFHMYHGAYYEYGDFINFHPKDAPIPFGVVRVIRGFDLDHSTPYFVIMSMQGIKDPDVGRGNEVASQKTQTLRSKLGIHPMEMMLRHVLLCSIPAIKSGWVLGFAKQQNDGHHAVQSRKARDMFFSNKTVDLPLSANVSDWACPTELHLLGYGKRRVQEIFGEAQLKTILL